MAGGKNLATKYANKADERFSKESQAMLAVNSDFEFTGANTVKVYSIPVVAMSDYQRNGSNRYGTPSDLTRNVQSLTVTKDRAFSFIIDKGDKVQSGHWVSKQIGRHDAACQGCPQCVLARPS